MTRPAMTIERAREILGEAMQPDGGIYRIGHYMSWSPGDDTATLDSMFTADELEAIACVMRAGEPT